MFFFLLSYRAYFLFSPGRNEAHSYSKGIEKVFTPTNTQYRLWSRMSNFGIRILPCWWALTPTERAGRRGCAVSDSELSHDRGAAKFSKLWTWGAQYLTRHRTSKRFVRATRPTFLCAINSTTTIKLESLLLQYHTNREFLTRGAQPLRNIWAKKCNPYRGMTLPAELAAVLSSVANIYGAWP